MLCVTGTGFTNAHVVQIHLPICTTGSYSHREASSSVLCARASGWNDQETELWNAPWYWLGSLVSRWLVNDFIWRMPYICYEHYAEAFERCYIWSLLIFSKPDDSNSWIRKHLPLLSFVFQNLSYSEIKQIKELQQMISSHKNLF